MERKARGSRSMAHVCAQAKAKLDAIKGNAQAKYKMRKQQALAQAHKAAERAKEMKVCSLGVALGAAAAERARSVVPQAKVTEMVRRVMEKFGITMKFIVTTVVVSTLLLLLIFAFLFIGMNALSGTNAISAAVGGGARVLRACMCSRELCLAQVNTVLVLVLTGGVNKSQGASNIAESAEEALEKFMRFIKQELNDLI